MTELKLVDDRPKSDTVVASEGPTSLSDHAFPSPQETPVHNFYDFKPETSPESERVKLRAVVGDTVPSGAPIAGTTQQEVLEFAKTFHQSPEANGMVGGVGGIGGGPNWSRYPTSRAVDAAESARLQEVRARNIAEREKTEELARVARVQQIKDDRIHDLFKSTGFKDLPEEMHTRLFNQCRRSVDLFMQFNPGIIPIVLYIPQTHNFIAVKTDEASQIKIGGVSSGGLTNAGGGQKQGGGSQNQQQQRKQEEADPDESTVGQKLKTVGRALLRLVQNDPPPADHPNYRAQTKEIHLLCGMANRLATLADEMRSGWGQVVDFTDEIEDLRADVRTLANHLYSKKRLSAEGLESANKISELANEPYSNSPNTKQSIIEAMEPLLSEQRR